MRADGIAVVLGTYNRRTALEACVASIRRAVGPVAYEIVVVDGGSTDGSREWLAAQPDVVLIGQRGPLTGAVRAFNLGFTYAVDAGWGYVCHFNDDAEFVGDGALFGALALLRQHPEAGEVAFEFDLYPGRRFDQIHGEVYANFGLVRRAAGVAAAQAQGDPNGKAWWNPIYHTYAADCEFACWLRKLGWTIIPGHGLRVHDMNVRDDLRTMNQAYNNKRGDSAQFWQRWEHKDWMMPTRAVKDISWQNARVILGTDSPRVKEWLRVEHPDGRSDTTLRSFSVLADIPPACIQELVWVHGPDCVPLNALNDVMIGLCRALKPGALLRVAATSLEQIGHSNHVITAQAINGILFASSRRYQGFTMQGLMNRLTDAGFTKAGPWNPDPVFGIDRSPLRVLVEATAPVAPHVVQKPPVVSSALPGPASAPPRPRRL